MRHKSPAVSPVGRLTETPVPSVVPVVVFRVPTGILGYSVGSPDTVAEGVLEGVDEGVELGVEEIEGVEDLVELGVLEGVDDLVEEGVSARIPGIPMVLAIHSSGVPLFVRLNVPGSSVAFWLRL